MKLLSKGLVAAAMVALAAGVAGAADKVKVGLAAEPYPPFSVPDASGNWSGWEVEIMQAVCREAELECEIAPTAWDGIIPALNSGRIDMIFNSMSITEARDEVIDFTEPYYRGATLVAGLKDLEMEPTAEGLAGKILGVQGATIHERYANKHFPDTEIKVYPTQEEAFQDLIAGRIDATQADAQSVKDFLASPAGQECCDGKGAVARDDAILGRGVGIGIREGDDALRERLNKAILATRESGEYQDITKKYFDFDMYTGGE